MDEQRQDDQQEPIHNIFVLIQDLALKIYREQWTIGSGGERGSGRSMLPARYDDDLFFYLYIIEALAANQVQILNKAIWISHSTNNLGIVMNQKNYPNSFGYVVKQIGFINVGMATRYGEGNDLIQTSSNLLKTDLTWYLRRG